MSTPNVNASTLSSPDLNSDDEALTIAREARRIAQASFDAVGRLSERIDSHTAEVKSSLDSAVAIMTRAEAANKEQDRLIAAHTKALESNTLALEVAEKARQEDKKAAAKKTKDLDNKLADLSMRDASKIALAFAGLIASIATVVTAIGLATAPQVPYILAAKYGIPASPIATASGPAYAPLPAPAPVPHAP